MTVKDYFFRIIFSVFNFFNFSAFILITYDIFIFSALSKLPVELNERWETATVTLPKEVKPGKVSLNIKFEGVLNDKMKGFYRSTYKNSEGKDECMATTQFEVKKKKKT